MNNNSLNNNFNISFAEFVKLIVQIVIVIIFIVTMQQNQEHINNDLDQIKAKLETVEVIKERVIILETKLSNKQMRGAKQ